MAQLSAQSMRPASWTFEVTEGEVIEDETFW